MYKYNRRKEIIKNTIYTIIILSIAIISTHYIYFKFQGDREVDFNSESMDIVYHETTGDKLTILKVTPVTDSVGLSSKSYMISIKNNLTENVKYKIKIVDDLETIVEDQCEENLIPKDDIKISVRVNKGQNKIYNLSELEEGILLDDEIYALENINISIRLWVKQDSKLPSGSKMHYHGKIQVIEDDDIVAENK